MKRNILRNTMTAAAFLLSGILSINAAAYDEVSAYHAGTATPYATFQKLSDALSNGNLADNDIIELNADIVETASSTISKDGLVIRSKSGGHYTVDLSSYTNFSTAVYTVAANDLNVNNITFANLNGNVGGDSGAIFHVRSNGTTTFGNKCIFRDNEVNISNGCCVLVKTPLNPALADKLGTVIVDGAQFIRNTGQHGAAVYLAGLRAELIVNGETLFQENIAKSGCGGAVTVESGAICTVNSGTFTKNDGEFGGGIYLRGKLTVNGGKFIENKKAIVTADGFEEMIVNDGLFEGNTANYGPAIQFQSWRGIPGQAIINGGTFKGNIATADGGAITVRCSNQDIHLEVKGGVFTGNEAAEGCGGAINVIPGAKLTLTGGTFTGNKALKGNSIDQGGIMCLSGSPVFGDDQDVYLRGDEISGMCTYSVITKVGTLDSSLNVPVTVSNVSAGRDILVSKSGATSSSNGKVVAGDSGHISVVTGTPLNYNASGLSSAASPYTPADVIEIGIGPFRVVSNGLLYPTLQQAVDAAASGDTIEVLPCSSFSVPEYNAETYSTNNTTSYYEANWGGEVYIYDKSLTIKSQNGKDSAPLKDFVLFFDGSATGREFILKDLKLTGKSKVIAYPGKLGSDLAVAGIKKLAIDDCDIEVSYPENLDGKAVKHTSASGGKPGIHNWAYKPCISFPDGSTKNLLSFELSKSKLISQGSPRLIFGVFQWVNASIHDNQFGSTENRTTSVIVNQDSYPTDVPFEYKVYNNTIYFGSNPQVLYLRMVTLPNLDSKVNVYDNNMMGTTDERPLTNKNIVYIEANSSNASKTTISTYRNYANGYCYNVLKADNPSNIIDNSQPGHTWDYGEPDAHIKDVPSGSTKNPDIYYNNKAYKYNEATGEFIEHDLGDAQYCDRCNELHVIPSLTIIANGLEEGQSAVFTVSRSVGDVDTPLLQVMIVGEEGDGGSRTVLGLEVGDYKVVPASWSWTYTVTPDSNAVSLDGTNSAEAEFTLEKKTTTLPENVEKVKVNNF